MAKTEPTVVVEATELSVVPATVNENGISAEVVVISEGSRDDNETPLPNDFSSGAEMKKVLMHHMIRYKDPQDFQGFHDMRVTEDKPCSKFYDLMKGEFWIIDMSRDGLAPYYVNGKRGQDTKVKGVESGCLQSTRVISDI